MKVVAFLNGKGGVGKSTICLNVALCLGLKGLKIAVVDTDPLLISSEFHHESMPFDVVELANDKELYKIKNSLSEYDYVLIDGAGSIDSILSASTFMSDLIVIPVTPSPLDFKASSTVISVIEGRNTTQSNKVIAKWLMNKVITGAKMTSILEEAIESTGIQMFKTKIMNRQSYLREMTKDGGNIFNGKDNKAIAEIELLTNEIMEVLENGY